MGNNKNRKIDCYGDMVFLWLNDKLPTYTDRAEIMKPILEMLVWTWHWKADGRIGAVASREAKKAGIISDPYVYQLRWAAEHYGAKNDLTSISMALQKMREDFQKDKTNLDHMDDNYNNCCLWNLAAMTRSQNTSKRNLTAKICDPFFWFSVNMGNHYRILYGNDIDNPQKMLCTKVIDYLEILARYCEDIGKLPKGHRIGYDQNGNLTDIGERMIRYLLTSSDEDFKRQQFWSVRPIC